MRNSARLIGWVPWHSGRPYLQCIEPTKVACVKNWTDSNHVARTVVTTTQRSRRYAFTEAGRLTIELLHWHGSYPHPARAVNSLAHFLCARRLERLTQAEIDPLWELTWLSTNSYERPLVARDGRKQKKLLRLYSEARQIIARHDFQVVPITVNRVAA